MFTRIVKYDDGLKPQYGVLKFSFLYFEYLYLYLYPYGVGYDWFIEDGTRFNSIEEAEENYKKSIEHFKNQKILKKERKKKNRPIAIVKKL